MSSTRSTKNSFTISRFTFCTSTSLSICSSRWCFQIWIVSYCNIQSILLVFIKGSEEEGEGKDKPLIMLPNCTFVLPAEAVWGNNESDK